MGADGGSIPDRRDLVRTKGAAEKTDKALQRERFLFCALSRKPLSKPVVADPLGKLYNKDAILEYLLDKTAYGDGEEICGYVRGVKDLLTLNLMPNPALEEDPSAVAASSRAPFVCWLSLKEMTGAIPFIAIRNCGCVFSESAVRSVIPNLARPTETKEKEEGPTEAGCPNCTKPFDPTSLAAVLQLWPTAAVQDLLLEGLMTLRAVQKANKKRKADSKEGKVKGAKNGDEPRAKVARTGSGSASPAPTGVPQPKAVNQSVRNQLAEQEKKRLASQAGMSDAVKSMFTKKEEGKRSDVNDFFGRTFNRYAA